MTWFKAAVFSVALLCATVVQAKSPAIEKNTVFWQISKADQPTSYLYAYYDFAKKDEQVPYAVWDVYDKTSRTIIAIDYPDENSEKFRREMQQMARLSQGGDLEKVLGKKRLDDARKAIRRYGDANWLATYDVQIEPFGNETQTVMFASALFYAMKPMSLENWDMRATKQIEDKSKADGKEILYLGGINANLRQFLKFSDRYWQLQVDNILDSGPKKFGAYIEKSYAAYQNNDIKTMRELEKKHELGRLSQADQDLIESDGAVYLKTMHDRYINRLVLMLPQKSSLIVVPVENVSRDDNLLSRLEEKGYTITPLSLNKQ